MDPILFFGGCIFLCLAFLSFFDRDRLWRIYNLERGWRARHPERTEQWDENTKRLGYLYLIIGIVTTVLGWSAGG